MNFWILKSHRGLSDRLRVWWNRTTVCRLLNWHTPCTWHTVLFYQKHINDERLQSERLRGHLNATNLMLIKANQTNHTLACRIGSQRKHIRQLKEKIRLLSDHT